MSRIWSRYINRQKYSECQLISAINAYYFLTRKTVKQDSEEYERLVDTCGGRHGAALRHGMQRVYREFGLKILEEHPTLWEFKQRRLPLPIEATLWHKRTGFHSVLIVDQCWKTHCLRITNFNQVTSTDGWMFREDLYLYEHKAPMMTCYRLFGRR